MAPEQLEGREADVRSDIFAFGAVLYEVVTGKKAFEGKSQASLIAAILERKPPAMSTLQPLTPPALDHIVHRCLAKDQDDRWQSARDVMRELQWVAEADAPPMVKTLARSGRRELVAWILAAVSTVAALSLVAPAVLYFRAATPDPSSIVLEVSTPATDDPISFAISPDGQQLVFVARGDSNANRLWVRPLDEKTARPLPGTDGATFPFWAPNGREVGFFADRKLKRIDVTAGAPEVIADAGSGRGGTWNQDDVILLAPDTGRGLARVSARGGPATPVTDLVGGQLGGPRWPQFLPDGRRFIFFLSPAPDNVRGVYLGSLDGGAPTRVLAADSAAVYEASGFLLVTRQDVLVALPFDASQGIVSGEGVRLADGVGTDNSLARGACSISSTGRFVYRGGVPTQRREFAWVDRAGRQLGKVPNADLITPGNPELSPNGRLVAVVSGGSSPGNVGIWFVELSRGVSSRFTLEQTSDINPVWSPDGGRVVYASNRNGTYDLFERDTNRAGPERTLLVTPEEKRPLSWSADGRHLLYLTAGSQTGRDLWALPMMEGQTPFPVVQTSFDEMKGKSRRMETGSRTRQRNPGDSRFTCNPFHERPTSAESPPRVAVRYVGRPTAGNCITWPPTRI